MRRPVPLSPEAVAAANARAQKTYTPKGGAVVREPVDAIYGRFRVLCRTDGLCIVVDTLGPPGVGPVFSGYSDDLTGEQASAEDVAREAAKILAAGGTL